MCLRCRFLSVNGAFIVLIPPAAPLKPICFVTRLGCSESRTYVSLHLSFPSLQRPVLGAMSGAQLAAVAGALAALYPGSLASAAGGVGAAGGAVSDALAAAGGRSGAVPSAARRRFVSELCFAARDKVNLLFIDKSMDGGESSLPVAVDFIAAQQRNASVCVHSIS